MGKQAEKKIGRSAEMPWRGVEDQQKKGTLLVTPRRELLCVLVRKE